MAPGGGSGTVGAVVDQVDDTASGVGIDTGLGEAAKPITDAADQLPGSLPGGNSVPDLLGGN